MRLGTRARTTARVALAVVLAAASALGPVTPAEADPIRPRHAEEGPVCTDAAYLMQLVGGSTDLYALDLVDGTQTKVPDTRVGASSIAYSTLDGYVYAFTNDRKLHRIDPVNGGFTTVTTTMPAGVNLNAATASADGRVMYLYDTFGTGSPRLYRLDMDFSSPDYGTVLKTTNMPTDPGNVADIALHARDGFLYGADLDGRLWRFNPATGGVTNLGVKLPAAAYGAAYADDLGNLYLANNDTGRIYHLDLTASTAASPIVSADIAKGTAVGKTNPTTGNDGAGCIRPYDYGDAPDTYATLRDSAGARAVADERLTIGSSVSAEIDARRSGGEDGVLDALGDNVDDGVTAWPPLSTASGDYGLGVAVSNTTGATATLAGWIDFDASGTFDDGELATADVPAGATSADLAWSDLSGLVAGATHVRLRLYEGEVGAPEPSGFFNGGGEVEDHRLTIAEPGLVIAKTADRAIAVPGDVVTYTVTLTNTGAADHPSTTFTDDLSGVIDDAAYNGDAKATMGEVVYTAPILTWTGAIPAGETVTLTYTATVDDTDRGDHLLRNTVTGPPGSNCPPGSALPACSATVGVPALAITKTAETDPTPLVPGGTVTYTITLDNTGQGAYHDATFDDDMSGVLDDATYNDDVSATGGSAQYTQPSLTWKGTIGAGEKVVITYSVTVNDPDTGDGTLTNTIIGPPGSNCVKGSPDPRCTTTVDIARLETSKTADKSTATPGETVTYTLTATNPTGTPYPGAVLTDDLSGVLDDAAYNGDAKATSGTASFSTPDLTWSGDVAPGQTVTITYSVTVDDPPTGDGELTNTLVGPPGSDCPPGSTEPRCSSTVGIPDLRVTKSADKTEAPPGTVVGYTLTLTNTGPGAYPAATVTDDLSGVLDDATYNGDAEATGGEVAYGEPKLTWTGDVASGATVTITYSVTTGDPFPAGDGLMANTVTGPPGSNCEPDSTDPACRSRVPTVKLDFGDAPDEYQTTIGERGASHRIVDGLRIGPSVTAERNGTPDPEADADRGDDGVLAVRGLEPGSRHVSVDVQVTNTGAAGAVLAAWIDFDMDGDEETGEGEQITVPAASGVTVHTLEWDGTVTPGAVFHVRLRLFGDAPLAEAVLLGEIAAISPVGYGGPGEVEDYRWFVGTPAPTPTPTPPTPTPTPPPGTPGGPGEPPLAATGGGTTDVTWLGAALVFIGGLALWTARRRRG